MNDSNQSFERAAELRRAFDRSFAEAPCSNPELAEDMLAIRVSGDPYAVRLSETAGLLADKKVIALPSPVRGILGMIGLRGNICPVYDLALLLGYPTAGVGRWVLLAGAVDAIGFSFPVFEGHLLVARQDIIVLREEDNPRRHVREVARTGSVVRPVISLGPLAGTIKKRVHTTGETAN